VLFGSTALLLAVIGIYGVLSYSVGLRSREIAIRLALGAKKADVLRLILRQGLGTTAVGLVAGLLGALALTRYLSQLLFEVTPIDPPTYLAVALLLLGAGLLASWIPARRALIADPVRTLRHE
jgi:putative ABC transport system permease protein